MTTKQTMLIVPRGLANQPPLSLDMSVVYVAEARIAETKSVTPMTAGELRGTFNEACNEVTKFLAWIKYEILMAKKELDLIKSEITIDEYPDELVKLREKGLKDNADYRDAFVRRNQKYQNQQQILLTLEATEQLLHSKSKTFERAYWDCRDIAKLRDREASLPNFSVHEGCTTEPQSNFMGKSDIPY